MVPKWTGECLAHRLFAKHYKGPIHPKLEVCHHCDNPPCVNPAHLFVGTKSDNQRDCERKGRRNRHGELNPCHTLTENQVIAIWSDNRTQGQIANFYGVHRTTINLIKSGKKWGWLTSKLKCAAHKRPMGRPF
ncbi:MAG: HNH endonuclease signature motif containing protein [Beijerinckiaceae bacterium]